jgi:hypothetical protein
MFFLFAAVFAAVSLSAARANPSDVAASAPPLEVTAKLVEIPSKFPPDDLYDYALVMKYEVMGGPLDKKTILVAHYKPRQARAEITDKMKKFVSGNLTRFKQGDVHNLKLAPKLEEIWRNAVIDDYLPADRTSVRYWCLKVDLAK